MNLLDKLSTLVKIEVNKLKKLGVHIFHNVNVGPFIQVDNRQININVGAAEATPKKLSQVASFVRQQTLVLDDAAKQKLDDFGKTEQGREIQELLTYFKGKIPEFDIPILRASLYLRAVHKRGEKTYTIKSDIIARYGKRGATIANLCSAGYFESLIKPIYEELASHPDFALEKFHKAYDAIIEDHVFAVFISNLISFTQAKTEVIRKIEINKRYGVHKMNLHAIGRENIDKIIALLHDHELRSKLTSSPNISAGRNYITVTIEF